MIYFAYGLSGFSAIALSFWKKEQLGLSAEQLLAIGAWAFVPWTAKVVFGQFVDSVKVFGSRRKVYIYIGAVLMALGTCILASLAAGAQWLSIFGDEFSVLLLASVLIATGFVVQDVTADTMSTEVIQRQQYQNGVLVDRSPQEIQSELATVQVLGRISLYVSSFLVAGLGGWLADNVAYSSIFWMQLVIPLVSCLGAFFVRLDPIPENEIKPLNPIILGSGIAFVVFSIVMGQSGVAYAQEIVFVVSAVFLVSMLLLVVKDIERPQRNILLMTILAIFLYRASPPIGPGVSWWAIDVLGFTPTFFGVLAQIGAFTGLAVLWLMSDLITKGQIKKILIILIVVESILFLPDLMMYHGVHEKIGVSAHALALFDTAAESPLVGISMVLILSLIAFYAPAGNRGTWFAIAASVTNLALTAGSILSKHLNSWFLVTREVKDDLGSVRVSADYSQLGDLMLVVLAITFTVPFLAVMLLIRAPRSKKRALS